MFGFEFNPGSHACRFPPAAAFSAKAGKVTTALLFRCAHWY